MNCAEVKFFGLLVSSALLCLFGPELGKGQSRVAKKHRGGASTPRPRALQFLCASVVLTCLTAPSYREVLMSAWRAPVKWTGSQLADFFFLFKLLYGAFSKNYSFLQGAALVPSSLQC